MTGRLVFMSTRTTGLSPGDDVWDFAAIIRDPGKPDAERQFFVHHDPRKAETLPIPFHIDYCARFDAEAALDQFDAAEQVRILTAGAHIVGVVPSFDTERLALLLNRIGYEPDWDDPQVDVVTLAVGYLYGRAHCGDLDAGLAIHDLPWDSGALSAACGITLPEQNEERCAALTDARWVRDLYDAVTGETA